MSSVQVPVWHLSVFHRTAKKMSVFGKYIVIAGLIAGTNSSVIMFLVCANSSVIMFLVCAGGLKYGDEQGQHGFHILRIDSALSLCTHSQSNDDNTPGLACYCKEVKIVTAYDAVALIQCRVSVLSLAMWAGLRQLQVKVARESIQGLYV